MTLSTLPRMTPITFEVGGWTTTKCAAAITLLLRHGKLAADQIGNPRVMFGGGNVGPVDISK